MKASNNPTLRHAHQAAWSFTARATAAVMQMITIVILARSLAPSAFAHAVAIQTVLVVVTSVNGFGLNRRLHYVRSRDAEDPEQAPIAAQMILYIWASVAALIFGSLGWALISWDPSALVLLPAAIWLYCEQITQMWNGISIIDGRAEQLLPSYLARRVPVVIVLLLAAQAGFDMNLALTSGMAVGGLISFAFGIRSAPPWARRLIVRRSQGMGFRKGSDFGIWFSQLGDQIRDLDTTVLMFVSPISAGLYALPARLVRPMGMMSLAVATVAFPIFARRDDVRVRTVALAAGLGALPTIVLTGLVYLGAPHVPSVVGDDFSASVSVLRILCLTTALWAPTTILITFAQSRDSRSATSFGVVLIALNSAMVMAVAGAGAIWGADEAAWVSVVMQAVTILVVGVHVLRLVRGETSASAR